MDELERARVIQPTLRRALLTWFDAERRALPWRETRDPYAIWLSEVMLQQTQVDRVIPYWRRFLERFPTVHALADAPLPDVLSLWSGLGYYSRARNLHRAAQAIVELHDGALPPTVDTLRELPGFGRYTAGAVASIAFDQPAPLVDGNVARVLARLFEVEGAAGERQRDQRLWGLAEALVASPRPGDWNQALMELGATVCTPRKPLCLLCPIRSDCLALAHGRVDELPKPKSAGQRRALELAVAIVVRKKRLLLARRLDSGLFGGLWEPPSSAILGGETGVGSLRRLLGPHAAIGPELKVVQRTLTHRDLTLHLHPVTAGGRLGPAPAGYAEWRWFAAAALGDLGMSSAMQRAIAEVTEFRK